MEQRTHGMACLYTSGQTGNSLNRISTYLEYLGIDSYLKRDSANINGTESVKTSLYVKPKDYAKASTYGTVFVMFEDMRDVFDSFGINIVEDMSRKINDFSMETSARKEAELD